MRDALHFQEVGDGKVQCLLCPQLCTLSEGKVGKCGVRRNLHGRLVTEIYGKLSAIHYDPIEKKPLYHFHPGNTILSIGSVGCNLSCSFCQNCDISQADVSRFPWLKDHAPEEIVKSYPTLTIEDVWVVIAFAAASVTDDFVFPMPGEFVA